MAGYVSPFETAAGSSKASNKYVSPFVAAAKGAAQQRKQQDAADAANAENAYINPPANASNTPSGAKKTGFLGHVGNALKDVAGATVDLVKNPAEIAAETGRAVAAEVTDNPAAVKASQARQAKNLNDSLIAQTVKPVYHLAKGEVVDNAVALLAQARGDKATQAAAEKMKMQDITPGNTLGTALDALGGKVLNHVAGKIAAKTGLSSLASKTAAKVTAAIHDNSILAQLPKVAKGDTAQAILNRNFTIKKYGDLAAPVMKTAEGMTDKDKKLLDRIEIPTPPDVPDKASVTGLDAFHGSTNDKLTSLVPGAKTGLNEKRNLVYLSEDKNAAASYAKNRGIGGLGELTDSETGKIYPAKVSGQVLDGQDRQALDKLKSAKGYEQLPGKTKNLITNETGLDSAILEANPQLRQFLSENGITAVRSHLPNGVGATELAVLDHSKISLGPSAEGVGQKIVINGKLAARRVEAVSKLADNPQQFKDVVAGMRDAYNKRLAGDVTLGRDVGFRHNYLPHMFNTKDDNVMSTLDQLTQKKMKLSKNPTPGYVKPRTIDTYAEADKIPLRDSNGKIVTDPAGKPVMLGSMRKNANALEDFQDAMTAAGQEHGSQALKLGLEQAHPGMVRVGETGFDPKVGEHFTSLHISGGKGLTMPESLAKDINARAAHEYSSGAFGRAAEIYDTKINNPLKTSVLGGGLFHMATTAGSTAGQQLVDALFHPIKAPGMLVDNLKVIAGTASKRVFSKLSAAQDARGLTDFASKVGTTLGKENFGGDVKNYRVPIIKNVHDAIFDRQIPAMKLMVMEQRMNEKFPGMDFHNPTAEQIAEGRSIASGVNNLGGINKAISGLTPAQAKILSRVWLAPDYTEGRVRNWANALNFTKNGAKEKIARETIVGKSIVFAIPGLAAATASGLIDWNDPKSVVANVKEQLLDPQVPLNQKGAPTATNPGGVPQSVHLPTTYLSEIGKIIKPMFDSTNPDKLSGAKSFVTNRSSAALSLGEKLVQNKDYYGDPIIGGTDKKGNPIDAKQSVANVVNQVLPIPAAQASKQLSGQQPLEDTVLNTAGGRVSADSNSVESNHSTAVNDFFNTLDSAQSAKSKASKQVTSLLMQGKPNQAARVATQWNQSIYNRIAPLKNKYKGGLYDPDWDTAFKGLVIPTTSRGFKARVKSGKLSQSLLQ